jgi:hypothetical protein
MEDFAKEFIKECDFKYSQSQMTAIFEFADWLEKQRGLTNRAVEGVRACSDCKEIEQDGVIHHKRGCSTVVPRN